VQSAVLRLHVVRPSVRLSVCDVGGSVPHRLKILGKISGKVAVGVLGLSTIFRTPVYGAHRSVVFAIAQLSCIHKVIYVVAIDHTT